MKGLEDKEIDEYERLPGVVRKPYVGTERW